MAFSRNSMAAAVAGTLSLAVLTGCPAQPQVQPPVASPSAGATTAPTAAPTAGATTAPTTAPTDGTPTVAPSVTPSQSPLAPTTVQGKVYDESGALVTSGAKVTIKSLNPSNPFETTVDVVNGNYVANQVPAGVLVEITAARDGWTSRTRVETPLPLSSQTQGGNQYNFGGSTDPYFISKYPEIISTEPADDATLADSTKLVYKLTLSEPLSSENQSRFAAALRVWPVNANAISGTTGLTVAGNLNVEDETVGGTDTTATAVGVPASTVPAVQEGTAFLSASNVAQVTWDAAGRVATLTFNAPVKTDDDDKAEYAVGLVSLNQTSLIVDSESNPLGQTIASNAVNFGGYATGSTATLIMNAFRKTELPVLTSAADTVAERWAETHDNVAEFLVNKDDTDPTLSAFTVVGRNTLVLTFSEPMAAAAGSSEFAPVSAAAPATTVLRFRMSVADNESDLTDRELVDADLTSTQLGAVTPLASLAAATEGNGTRPNIYTFTVGATGTDGFEAKVDENDPKVVRIRRFGISGSNAAATDRFQSGVKFVRIAVLPSVTDPATNPIVTANRANLKNATL